jgi:L-alanine-DL-glutamate epimerase-like enolase superfamily enzyme
MKVTAIETLHCDAGWRNFSFVKASTDEGLVGWSEYQEGFGSPGVTAVIDGLAAQVVGRDARATERIYWDLYAVTRPAAGGVVGQGIAAIENALLDVKAKALGVPVCELLGGPVRERIRVYWSHCGTYRVAWPEAHGATLRSLDDVRALGREVADAGFTALKTNVFLFDREPALFAPGFNMPPGYPELNAEAEVIAALRAELEAFRDGAGPDVDLLLDLNFNFKTEGYRKIVRALDPLGLFWIEIDSYDAEALADVRRVSQTPISSCETLIGIREFRPYFRHRSIDVAIVDAIWNGVWQSMKIAAFAEACEVNIAPHNFYGHLSTMMNAQFVASVPNFRIMEIDIDQVPWRDELFTHVPEIENGYLKLPMTPGWGTEPIEEALAAHPPKQVGGLLDRG